jgi:hypothetical protein
MSSRDQPFSDRASVFWGTTAERFARVPRQRQLSLQRSDALVGCGELVGLHAWDAFDHASIDKCLALLAKKRGLADPCLCRDHGDRLTRSQARNDLPAHRRRIHTGHVTSR